MAPLRLKGPFWVHRGSTRVDLARRWLDEQAELGHQAPQTPAELARAVGIDRKTARKALRLPPIPYTGNGEIQVDRSMVPLRISPTAKILWTFLRRHESPDGVCWLSERSIAAVIGVSLHAVHRSLKSLRRLGYLTETKRVAQGTRTYVGRRWVKPGTVGGENRVQWVGKTGYSEVGKTGYGTGSTDRQPTPSVWQARFRIDESDPATWPRFARQGGGGFAALKWAILSSSAVLDVIGDPPTAAEISDVLRCAEVRVAGLYGPRLAAAGLSKGELRDQLVAARDATTAKSRAGVLVANLKRSLDERDQAR